LKLSAILTAVLVWVAWKLPDGWKVAAPILCFAYFFTGMEIIGYYRHDREIKKLLESESETPNKEDALDQKETM
jgi:glycerol-3-phosphate acyltransferase PlsY